MKVKRYELVSVDPLNTDDERQVFGTFTLESARRIVGRYNRRAECTRVAVIRPVYCHLPPGHAYYAELTFTSELRINKSIIARDPCEAVRYALLRHGQRLARVRVWILKQDHAAGCRPHVEATNCGTHFKARISA